MKKRMMGLTTFIAISAIVSTLSLNANAGIIDKIEIKDIKTAIASVEKAVDAAVNTKAAKEVAVAAGKKSADAAGESAASAGNAKKVQATTTETAPAAPAQTENTASAAASDNTAVQATSDSANSSTVSTAAAAPEPEAAPSETNGILTSGNAQVDISSIGDGVVRVKYPHSSGLKIKVKIALGSSSYMYSLYSTSGYETYPLQMGNGNYTITVYENVGGTSYTAAAKFDVTLYDSSNVFLNSIQLINWNSSTNAVVKAREIASAYGSNEAKAQAIHDFLTSQMQYDSAKASSVSSGYIPDINYVYGSGYGICYDFASTYAAMLRSVGIPTKLVMGYSSNVSGYHAWNKVYLNGSWVVVDNSYDSQAKALGQSPEWIKSSSLYNGQKEY
ncbi:MAG: transglutaminase [Firmicutes bacterium]|nr:transglutaminase [Bacillota bacterium]